MIRIYYVLISVSVVIIFSSYPFFPLIIEIRLKKHILCSEEDST